MHSIRLHPYSQLLLNFVALDPNLWSLRLKGIARAFALVVNKQHRVGQTKTNKEKKIKKNPYRAFIFITWFIFFSFCGARESTLIDQNQGSKFIYSRVSMSLGRV